MANAAEYAELLAQMRRYGHIAEGTRGNPASAVTGRERQARSGVYHAEEQIEHINQQPYFCWVVQQLWPAGEPVGNQELTPTYAPFISL